MGAVLWVLACTSFLVGASVLTYSLMIADASRYQSEAQMPEARSDARFMAFFVGLLIFSILAGFSSCMVINKMFS